MKTSKTLLATIAAGVLGLALVTPQAAAFPLTGDLTINGVVRYDTQSLATATQAIQFGLTSVEAPLGSGVFVISGTPVVSDGSGTLLAQAPIGTPVTFTVPYVLNSAAPITLYTAGPLTFALSSSTVVARSASFINVEGVGTLTSTVLGSEPTVGLWTFSSTSSGGNSAATFGFTSNTAGRAPGVPEGGSALALLGMAFAGIELARRKLAARR